MTGNNQRASLHICTNNGEDEYYPPPPFHQSDSEKIRRDIIFQFKRMENICGYFDLRDRSRYIGKKEIQSGKWDVYVYYTQRAKKEYLPDMVGRPLLLLWICTVCRILFTGLQFETTR